MSTGSRETLLAELALAAAAAKVPRRAKDTIEVSCVPGRSATVGSASLPGLCGDLPGIERALLSAATNSEAR